MAGKELPTISASCVCGGPIKRVRRHQVDGILPYALSTMPESHIWFTGSCGNGCVEKELTTLGHCSTVEEAGRILGIR